MNQDQEYNNLVSSNQGFNDNSALQVRLDTAKILEDLRTYLRGYYVEHVQTSEGVQAQKIQVGNPKANELGVQSIMSYAGMLINGQTVQGNIDRDQYELFVKEVHLDLSEDLVINRYKWDVKEEDMFGIVNTLIGSLQLFATRPIQNKERESYQNWMRTVESTHTKEKDSGFNLFGGFKK